MAFWNSVKRKLHRLAKLSNRDRWLLLQTAVLLPLVAIGRRLVSFKRLQTILEYIFPYPSRAPIVSESNLDAARQIARMVQVVGAHMPLHTNCLDRSLTLWSLLRSRGIAADLQIGVRKDGGEFEAHAWIEYQGVVVNDVEDVRERFAAFPDLAERNIR